MAIQFKIKCMRCKKNYVIVTHRMHGFVQCYDCEKGQLEGEIKDKAMRAFFDLPEEFYRDNRFLRSVKIQYMRFGSITEKQREFFVKAAEQMRKRSTES